MILIPMLPIILMTPTYIAANKLLKKFKTSIASAAPSSEFSVRRAVVPSGLPFLQLKGDSIFGNKIKMFL